MQTLLYQNRIVELLQRGQLARFDQREFVDEEQEVTVRGVEVRCVQHRRASVSVLLQTSSDTWLNSPSMLSAQICAKWWL